MDATTHIIKGRPNVRSVATAAAVSVVGMLLVILVGFLKLGEPMLYIALAMAGVGVGLVMAAQNAARKASVHAQLNDEGFLLASNRTQYGLEWKNVKKVTMRANEIVITDKQGQEARIVAPRGSEPAELDDLAAAMAARLDASRGYR